MVQCRLGQGKRITTGWIEGNVKTGDLVRLEGETGWWMVLSVSRPVERASIRRGWKNNI